MTGAAAAVIFPAMKGLDPALPAYAAYTGPHWSLAAGQIANRLFIIADTVQFGAMLAAGVTFGLCVLFFGLSTRRGTTFARAALLLALVGVLSYHLMILSPRMATNVRLYWDAAAAGDNAGAAGPKAAFDADHPTASRVLGATALLVLGAMVAGMVSITAGRRMEEGP
jgi:hypothetical protein